MKEHTGLYAPSNLDIDVPFIDCFARTDQDIAKACELWQSKLNQKLQGSR